jgi:DNA-binding response OmpR family regulator
MNGLELLSKLRAEKIATPVILLTARGGIDDRVHGLNAGADDYLGKPFSPAELLARVRALLRRNAGLSSEKIILGAVTLDIRGRVVFRDGQEVSLTPREYGILELLAFNLNRVVSRLTIAEHVWDDNFDLMTNVVDVHIRNLRKKLNDDGSLIRSVRGLGYTIREQNDGLG